MPYRIAFPPPAAAGASRSPHAGRLIRQSFAAMTARERARLVAMYGVMGVAVGERQGTGALRLLGFGFFFALGHSTVVVAIGAGIVVAEKSVFGAVSDSGSGLERFGGLFGTVVSAAFLLLIGLLNLVV